ncbi:E3 ubiquitin-protein ligase PPP1R11 isoform X2 [Octopus bimaculoides]|uniref:E3 ubiquitin-protein ligase PPP1R11 isoform X2 n=1 Tax=Octopus bimaculoides TaxID=37653 RepID=UPI00071CE4F0|nr:E3 ubiquitin-protein ligase PPP1R11 isoform X2 [Octopus bimaculoides]|eukprot:XP_014774441.1 PREDICTED: protein phosphatase 1 regulatory subunit 11-like isoform X2 [Octopus bimaculoides]
MAERSLTLTRTNLELSERSPTLHLRLKKVKNSKKVKWTNDTVDNEGLNRKKSKCCCIYEKPRSFGESSSEEDNEECNSCHGHKSQCYRTKDPTGTELEGLPKGKIIHTKIITVKMARIIKITIIIIMEQEESL